MLITDPQRFVHPNLTQAKPRDPVKSAASPLAALFCPEGLAPYQQAVSQALNLISKTLVECRQPFSGATPDRLRESFGDIDLGQPLPDLETALGEVERLYLRDAVYFHHPRYVAHLNCPIAWPAIVAELISTSINTSVDTWDQSAGATLIEQKLVAWTCALLGLGRKADGVFTSGGTQSNLMALLLARDHYCRLHLYGHCTKQHGLPEQAKRFRIFASHYAHFSVQKSAAVLGLGYQAVNGVSADENFRMRPDALRREIEKCRAQGLLPLCVVATAGLTDFGSIDPIEETAALCRHYDIWLHVDAAYGCGLLASPTRGENLAGIEKADSVTVDFHKSFLQPVACSALLVRDEANLQAVTYHAEYLNPLSAKQDGTPDLVNKSLQTTRRFDALKLWLTLRVVGVKKVGEIFDAVCALARYTADILQDSRDFEVLHQPELSTLVFRYSPKADEQILDTLNRNIRKTLLNEGKVLIASTKVHGRVYLKFTLLNPATSEQDMHDIIDHIRKAGQDHLAQTAAEFSRTEENEHER